MVTFEQLLTYIKEITIQNDYESTDTISYSLVYFLFNGSQQRYYSPTSRQNNYKWKKQSVDYIQLRYERRRQHLQLLHKGKLSVSRFCDERKRQPCIIIFQQKSVRYIARMYLHKQLHKCQR